MCKRPGLGGWLVVTVLLGLVWQSLSQEASWQTVNHSPGMCAVYGTCGEDIQEKGVPCPQNTPAKKVSAHMSTVLGDHCPSLWAQYGDGGKACCTKDQLDALWESVAQARNLFQGCPACLHNFIHLWCTVSCSPDQATFMNVTRVQKGDSNGTLEVKEAEYFFSDRFKDTIYDSCSNVTISPTNTRALLFLGNPSTAQELFDTLGAPSSGGGPAPYHLQFPPGSDAPDGMVAVNDEMPQCWSRGFECSCVDCSAAEYCSGGIPSGSSGSQASSGCSAVGLSSIPLTCWDLSVIVLYRVVLGAVVVAIVAVWLKGGLLRHVFDTLSAGNQDFASGYDGTSDCGEVDIPPALVNVVYKPIEGWLRGWFRKQGEIVACYPFFVITAGAILVGLCAIGLVWFKVETDPQMLWVSKTSRAWKDKVHYEQSFGPFYRVENFILSTTKRTVPHWDSPGLPSVVREEVLEVMFDIQDKITNLTATVVEGKAVYNVTLESVCFKPTGNQCGTQSVLQYWQMDRGNWEQQKGSINAGDRLEYLLQCFQHWPRQCYTDYGAPQDPKTVLGGFPPGTTASEYGDNSTAFIVTYLLDSSSEVREAVMAWEAEFLALAKQELQYLARDANLSFSFYTEQSVQDELERESNADARTVAISYIVMFAYIAIALSSLPQHQKHFTQFAVHSKVLLGMGGVLIVAASVLGALGLCGWMRLRATLIIMEVIPFLVLAVGVDNMFIMAYELHHQNRSLPFFMRLGEAMSISGPSIALAAAAEVLAFGLAALVPVPAVRSFSLCACLALFIDFVLQVTVFAALLVLDAARTESNRVDCMPCLKVSDPSAEETMYTVVDSGTPSQGSVPEPPRMLLQAYVTRVHAPLILKPIAQIVILLLALTFFCVCLALSARLSKGLEQQVALPRNSYLQDYFEDQMEFLRVGPPALFVVKDLNMSQSSLDVDKICGKALCSNDSLLAQIAAAKSGHMYHLESTAASWLDDFMVWINPSLEYGCHVYQNGTTQCFDDHGVYPPKCQKCITRDFPPGSRPSIREVQKLLPWFLTTLPSEKCAQAGAAAYSDSIQMDPSDPTGIAGLKNGIITASSFRSAYTPLNSQADFINALADTYKFVDMVSSDLKMDIYAYSIFHIFFESYLNITVQATFILMSTVLAAAVVCWVVLGSFRAALLVLFCVAMTLVDLMGVMYLWDIQLNGVSVVNLTMGVGIAVEFCVHIAHAFVSLPGKRGIRMVGSLESVGAAVISGITVTKFVGVVVLAFSNTQIFEIYYFRMYLALVILGAIHGLVVLPVMLVLFGPPAPVLRDNELDSNPNVSEHHAAENRYRPPSVANGDPIEDPEGERQRCEDPPGSEEAVGRVPGIYRNIVTHLTSLVTPKETK